MADVKDHLARVDSPAEPPPAYDSAAQPLLSNGPPPQPKPHPLRPPLPLDIPALNAIRGKRVILASASPRRKQLLAQLGLHNLEIIPSTHPEDLPKSLSPIDYVLRTATQKALTVYTTEIDSPRGEPVLLIAADTIVVSRSGAILEKPRSESQHIAMLKTLRDSGSHKVFTAVCVMAPLASARDPGYAQETAVEETVVRFDKEVGDELLLAYVRTREGVDKAGGYAVQGAGAVLVEGIEGSWDNVVGLPLRVTVGLMERVLVKALEEEPVGEEEEGEGEGEGEEDDEEP